MIVADGSIPWISIDALKDFYGGDLPSEVVVEGSDVEITTCGAGRGVRQLFRCPKCGKGRLFLFMPEWDPDPACRECHDLINLHGWDTGDNEP